MKISAIDKIIEKDIGKIIREACECFIGNDEYKEDSMAKCSSDKCLRDLINETLVSKLSAKILVWGKTDNPQQSEVSFRDILFDKSLKNSHLPNGIGGVDVVVSPNDTLKKGLSSKEFNKDNPLYSDGYFRLKKDFQKVFKEEIICIEVKILHYNKKFKKQLKTGKPLYCDESQYFLSGKHWDKLDYYSFDVKNPSTLCSGQLLSDVARGAYILNKQSDTQKFYLMGVIIGKGDGQVVNSGDEDEAVDDPQECIKSRISDLIDIMKTATKLLYGKKTYTPNVVNDLSNIDIDIKVHEIVWKTTEAEKAKNGIFMYPYHIILKKK